MPDLYEPIVNIIKMNKKDAEVKMADYLHNWYTLHKNEPLHDTHKNQKDYAGYWCWEAAAVVKIMR